MSQPTHQSQDDRELADRLAAIIEGTNQRVKPIIQNIRSTIEHFKLEKEEDRDEQELIDTIRPLIQEAEKELYEANGAVRGADPDNRLSNRATRNYENHTATPEEQRLADALGQLAKDVGGTIEWAKNELDSIPKAKQDLGPLFDALGQPLTQIVGAVGLLVGGVLNLLGRILSGIGLDGALKEIIGSIGLDKIFKAVGGDKWLNGFL
ncbi:unnamed protein product [Peniophora sp. CBMAI 1063]|nr:unnamed protein product [Peniophora sp. CBMAI 1063]